MIKCGKYFISALLLTQFFSIDSFALNSQQYSRSSSVVFETIEDARVEKSHAYSSYSWLFNLGLSYVDTPLTVKNSSNSDQLDSVVSNMLSMHLGASWYLKDYLQFGVQTYFSQFEANSVGSQSGLGDFDLRLKLRLFHNERSGFSIMPQVIIPTSQGKINLMDSSGFDFGEDAVLSDQGLGYGLNLIYEKVFDSFQLAFNIGYLVNPKAEFIDLRGVTQIDFTKRLKAGFGAFVPISKKWGVNIEYLKNWSAPLFNDDINPNEIFLGSSFGLKKGLTGFGGVSLGNLVDSDDGNDYRFSFGVKYSPLNENKKTVVQRKPRVFNLKEIVKVVEPVAAPELVEPIKFFTCGKKYAFGNTDVAILYYGNNVHKLGVNQQKILKNISEVFRRREKHIKEVRIYGHTSSVASSDYNKILGRKRANGVYTFLVAQGVNPKILVETESRGEADLVSTGETAEAHKNNRRTELTVLFKEEYKKECI